MYEIKSTASLRKLMKDYFMQLDGHSRTGSKPVAWCTSVGPAELLRAAGFEVYFPENHGALLGATRSATDYIPVAAKCGYSSHICSYTTSDIGAFLMKETPLKKHYQVDSIPRPDLIVFCTNQCREVQDWFTFYADHYKCPIAGIFPPRHLDEVSEEDIEFVAGQFRKLAAVCEKVTGKKFDPGRFRETVGLSREATLLWQKVLETARESPPPFGFFDGTIHMGPIVVLRGTTEARDYYRELLSELEGNIRKQAGYMAKEECRIFWDGMPMWGKLRMLSDLFFQNKAAVVASTYCSSWIFDSLDENRPFESSALAYTEIFINRSEKAKMKFLRKWISDYKIDGVVFHDAKTCFNNSNARFGLPARLKEETGIPTLVIEGDLNDLRFFSEGQSTTKIETFIEQLVHQKVFS